MFITGKFQFTYNSGNGDIRVYDIFDSGQVRETIAKTNEVNYVTSDYAIDKLKEMYELEKRKYAKFKKTPHINKTIAAKIEEYKMMGRFMEEHPIEEKDIRWFD